VHEFALLGWIVVVTAVHKLSHVPCAFGVVAALLSEETAFKREWVHDVHFLEDDNTSCW
jgi:hypothetical protein